LKQEFFPLIGDRSPNFEEKIEGFIKGRIGGFFRQILRAATIKILNSLLNFLTDS
jgi:hypothetical protein